MTRQTARGIEAALETDSAGRATRRAGDHHSAALRTNAPASPPQRTPRFPDTPWGRLRAAHGWSLRELARRTRISTGDLSRIERFTGGVTPDQARLLIAVFDYREPETESATNPGPALIAYAQDYAAIRDRGDGA